MFTSHRVITMLAPAALLLLTVSLMPEHALAADDSQEARSVTLQYRNIDLNTQQGAASLYRRIRAAATSVCSPFESRLLERQALWERCFSDAVGNAVAAVHNETLSAYHWQHVRGSKQPRIEAPTSLASR
jgi:UrcA family protein